jgi:hypothetical protein
MTRVLFDKNVPYSLKRYLARYRVSTADDEGWGQISNGALLSLAEKAGYHIALTSDQNIQYQQNLKDRVISLVVIGSNIWPSVKLYIDQINAALDRSSPGSFEFVEIPAPRKRRRLGDQNS